MVDPKPHAAPRSIETRFKLVSCSDEDCAAAIRGESLPVALGCHIAQLCVLRGIRHHHGFATQLRGIAGHPEFTRALNARAIMSNQVPRIAEPSEIPYCIWYPDVAEEDTYRALFHQYPQMRYHVARACAAAGYADLYRELDVLPDIAIAEEARDNSHREGSAEIFEAIMKQPLRWSVMNDYSRSINAAKPIPAKYGLNADTAVRSSLVARQTLLPSPLAGFRDFEEYLARDPDSPPSYFNITEDWGMSEVDADSSLAKRRITSTGDEMTALLWNPLPNDLPEGNKDILILMAAYHGNIDRYERLRRPKMLQAEPSCIVRGIYHNTMFAKWWSLRSDASLFQRAINARFIMCNDLSRITESTPDNELPYMIWYPTWAHSTTYEELARRKPVMLPAVARACIRANYQSLWDKLDIVPSTELFAEAKAAPNTRFLTDLNHRCDEQRLTHLKAKMSESSSTSFTGDQPMELSGTELFPAVSPEDVQWDQEGPYDGYMAHVGAVDLFVCTPVAMRPSPEEAYLDIVTMHEKMIDSSMDPRRF